MSKDKAWAKEQLEYYIKAVGDPFNNRTHAMINAYKNVEHIINQLDEPQKPIIPQFVADYIENYKGREYSLGTWLHFVYVDEFERKTKEWIYSGSYEENLKREYLLIDAIRYGYEVEKEKRYYIINKENNATLMTFELSDVVGEEVIEFVYGYSENETIHFNSKEKAELIAHFVGESLEVEEVTK